MARLIVLAGLPAVGKSSLARALAQRTGAVWLRVDSMDQAIWASGTAPADLQDWTYRAAQAVAADNLALGREVIADCVNDLQAARAGWQAAGDRAGAEVVWLQIVCSDPAEHRRRVETRTSDIAGLPLPAWDAVRARDYQPWDRPPVTIDTADTSLAECVAAALAALARPTADGRRAAAAKKPDHAEIVPRHDLTPDEVDGLELRLYEHNARRTGYADGAGLAFLAEAAGQRVGAVAGYSWGGICELRQVWVDEAWRGHGLGRRLMDRAVQEARARGCAQVFLTTYDFQAPGFYAKLGFRPIAELPDKPLGHRELVMRLSLTDAD